MPGSGRMGSVYMSSSGRMGSDGSVRRMENKYLADLVRENLSKYVPHNGMLVLRSELNKEKEDQLKKTEKKIEENYTHDVIDLTREVIVEEPRVAKKAKLAHSTSSNSNSSGNSSSENSIGGATTVSMPLEFLYTEDTDGNEYIKDLCSKIKTVNKYNPEALEKIQSIGM